MLCFLASLTPCWDSSCFRTMHCSMDHHRYSSKRPHWIITGIHPRDHDGSSQPGIHPRDHVMDHHRYSSKRPSTRYCDHSFPVAGANLWNALPVDLCKPLPCASFKKNVKKKKKISRTAELVLLRLWLLCGYHLLGWDIGRISVLLPVLHRPANR